MPEPSRTRWLLTALGAGLTLLSVAVALLVTAAGDAPGDGESESGRASSGPANRVLPRALAEARAARERGDYRAAAAALARADYADPELGREVAEELAREAERRAAEWKTDEARRLLEIARRVLPRSPEVRGAEWAAKEAERRARELRDLLARAAEAEESGDLALAAELYRKAARLDGPPDLVSRAREKAKEVGDRARAEEDREALLAKVAKLLDEGKVRQARELLSGYAERTGDAGLAAHAAALRDLEEAGGGKSYLPVRRALRWLAAHQDPADGGFHGQTFAARCRDPACAGPGPANYDTGVTGLALMAFTAFTELDVLEEFRAPADRAAKYLLASVDAKGREPSASGIAGGYTESIVALALLERARVVSAPGPEVAAATRIVNHLLTAAQNDDGGWRYRPGSPVSDVSVTCWALQALHAAKSAGLPVPEDNLYRALNFLDYLTDADGRTSYLLTTHRYVTMTPAALLAKELFGARRDSRLIEASIRYTARFRPDAYLRKGGRRSGKDPARDALTLYSSKPSFYQLYYQTYALRLAGGTQWKYFGPAVERLLAKTQETAGHSLGSWDPVLGWSRNAGRLYATAMAALTLEVYYRAKAGLTLAPRKKR